MFEHGSNREMECEDDDGKTDGKRIAIAGLSRVI